MHYPEKFWKNLNSSRIISYTCLNHEISKMQKLESPTLSNETGVCFILDPHA